MHQKWRHGGAAGAHSLQLLLLGAVPVQDLAHALLGILLPRSVASEARLGASDQHPGVVSDAHSRSVLHVGPE